MNNKKLKEKDWQLLTARNSVKTLAYLKTIIENQAFIISHLKEIPFNVVASNIKNHIAENENIVYNKIDLEIPNNEDFPKWLEDYYEKKLNKN